MSFIDTLNLIYERTYGYPIIKEKGTTPENKKAVDTLLGLLHSTPLKEGDTREDLYEYYCIVLIAYLNRVHMFSPSIRLLCSCKGKLAEAILKRYSSGIPILDSERVCSRQLKPHKEKAPGLFFGYPFDQVKAFSKESTEYLLVNILLRKDKSSILPALSIIYLLDRVFFMCLGNNMLEEKKEAEGHGVISELYTDYKVLSKIHSLKLYLRTRRQTVDHVDPYTAAECNPTSRLGKYDMTYCEAIVWAKALEHNDTQVLEYIKTVTRSDLDGTLLLETIKVSIQDMFKDTEIGDREQIKRMLIQKDMHWVQEDIVKYKLSQQSKEA